MPGQSQKGANGAQRRSQNAPTPPITKAEALELLQSASSYCARAGLGIEIVALDDGRVALALAGVTASVTDGRVAFAVSAPTTAI